MFIQTDQSFVITVLEWADVESKLQPVVASLGDPDFVYL